MNVPEAYAACLAIARSHYENFPVASWLVPRQLRRHIAAIYAFARRADDMADEGQLTMQERIDGLELLQSRLRLPDFTDPVDVALSDTITRFTLPLEPFDRLLAAFRSDIGDVHHQTWESVLEYCSCSANPVGELLLRLEYSPNTPPVEAITASNAICSALQITNFLQDLAIDRQRGREYLPLDDNEMLERTYQLYNDGQRVVLYIRSWRLRWEIAATIAGGLTMLDLCAERADRLTRPRLQMRNSLDVIRRLWHIYNQHPPKRSPRLMYQASKS